jgi:hypothetical protein
VAFFGTPLRLRCGIAVAVVLLVIFGAAGIDGAVNYGKIHTGVTVAGIDVGGMSVSDAASTLQIKLMASADAAPVALYATNDAAQGGVTDATVDLQQGLGSYSAPNDATQDTSWLINTSTIGASVDGQALAEQAYAVGRGSDYLPGRLQAIFGGVHLGWQYTYDSNQLHALANVISSSLGYQPQDATITYNGNGGFTVGQGSDGYLVDEGALSQELNQAFFATDPNRCAVIPMHTVAVDVTTDMATAAAQQATQAIASPVTLSAADGSATWQLDASDLGPWIAASAQTASDGSRVFVPYVDASKLANDIDGIVGDANPGVNPVDASFKVVDGAMTVVPSQDGTGIDTQTIAADLDSVLFGNSATR